MTEGTCSKFNERLEDDSEDEEILEESPCGRYSKRREEVQQRDVPGIDNAYLAMDTEDGVEVVWNEVQFSERKDLKSEKIERVFDSLIELEHPNIVKFHKYWLDTMNQAKRMIFITEYMSSGSLKQFLKRTKRNVKHLPIQTWKRWCIQVLSALSYLHSCGPPIIHGNLTCDTIFIQHNGLIKIGSVAPEAIHHHVKTCRDHIRNVHFIAPEYANQTKDVCMCANCLCERGITTSAESERFRDRAGGVSPASDIYSFGVCALEMAALEIQGNGENNANVSPDNIQHTLDSLSDPQQKDFIEKCLRPDPSTRPTARQLLFHPILFEVHSLKLLAAHITVKNSKVFPESVIEEAIHKHYGTPDAPLADLVSGSETKEFSLSNLPVIEKLEKFMEDVKFGIYPLTAFALAQPGPSKIATQSNHSSTPHPSASPVILPPGSASSEPPRPSDPPAAEVSQPMGGSLVEKKNGEEQEEKRRIVTMMCNVKYKDGVRDVIDMTIMVRLEDGTNRQMSCECEPAMSCSDLAEELVFYGLICKEDKVRMEALITEAMQQSLHEGEERSETPVAAGQGESIAVCNGVEGSPASDETIHEERTNDVPAEN